jgi:hypothetical protein
MRFCPHALLSYALLSTCDLVRSPTFLSLFIFQFVPFSEVLIHTLLDLLTDEEGGKREINHHGTVLTAAEIMEQLKNQGDNKALFNRRGNKNQK